MNKYKSKPQKRPLLLFSGGLDSTYALLCQLAVTSVDLLIVKSTRLPPGQAAEELARNAVIAKIKQDTASGKLKHGIINIHVVNYEVHSGSMELGTKFAQLKFWMASAMEVVNPEIHSHVYVGYISGDQISAHIPDIKKVWKYLYKVSKIGKVKISFPLLYLTKQDIVDRLEHTSNDEYLKMTWHCEFPETISKGKGKNKQSEFKPCGTCMSCRRMSEVKINDNSTVEIKPQLNK